MAKTLAQIEKALKERYSGNTYEKKGMTYAAWEDIVYAANDIFGPLGWSREFVKAPYREGDGFACILRVTVYYETEDGVLRSIPFEAPGYNELAYTQSNAELTDTAFKGCYADALKKVLQALGDAFALFIGSEAKAAKAANKTQNNGGGQDRVVKKSSGGGWGDKPALEEVGNGGLSQAQIGFAKKLGVTDDELETMTRAEVKAILDNKGRPGQASQGERRAVATASRVGTPDDEDENPFA